MAVAAAGVLHENIRHARRHWRSEKCLCRELALGLAIKLVRRRRILRIHLGHHELPQQLDLLDLGERDFVTHLNRLEIADRGLVLHSKLCSAPARPENSGPATARSGARRSGY